MLTQGNCPNEIDYMQVVYHIGAHCTDEDRLLRSLLKNRGELQQHGVHIPGPSKYRKLIRQTVKSLGGAPPAAGAESQLLKSITDSEDIKRLVLSADDFLAFVAWTFTNGDIYGNAPSRIPALASLFPSAEIEFALGMRNPATFIPAVFARTSDIGFDQFMRGLSPKDMRWSSLVHSIRASVPDAKVTVWCNEDTPLIWPQLMHRLSGVRPEHPFLGEADLLAEIMTKDGVIRYDTYLQSHPPQSDAQHSSIIMAFLDKFAINDAIEEDLDAPGWTQALVDEMTHSYEQDLDVISCISGVDFIAP